MLPVAMASIRPYHLQWLIMKSGLGYMPIIGLRKYKFIQFHSDLLYCIDNACEYIIFVRSLYESKIKKQATGDQYSDVI